MASLTTERDELNTQITAASTEIERLKQEAVESKKVAVATEDYEADSSEGGDDAEDAPAEEGEADESAEPASE